MSLNTSDRPALSLQQQQQQQQQSPPSEQHILSRPNPPLLQTSLPTSSPPPQPSKDGSTSPVAPDYSPITPEVRPVLPDLSNHPPLPPPLSDSVLAQHVQAPVMQQEEGGQAQQQHQLQQQQPEQTNPAAASLDTEQPKFIPELPPQPFSSADSTDAIALRAALSSLQFQRKKAQDDILSLERLRGRALDDPGRFRTELAAGRLKEERPSIGDWRAVLDGEDEDDSDDDDDLTKDEATHNYDTKMTEARTNSNTPSAQALDDDTPSRRQKDSDSSAPFSRIPGPQNVVRMPYINWEKYHIAGEGLEQLHDLQKRWPGTSFAYSGSGGRGREHAVAAPYSPWLDQLPSRRNDSVTGTVVGTGTNAARSSTVSEHPMETRRGGRMH